MIWTIIIIVIAFFVIKFLWDLNKDNEDLIGKTASEKFAVIVDILNDVAYGGNGSVTTFDKRTFNLYEVGSNQIIQFTYSTGNLTIKWKYKYFQKEVVHERIFDNVRNLSIFEQEKIALRMVEEMQRVVEKHQRDVLS